MTGQFGRRDEALEAGQRRMWLEAIWRVTGVDPQELRPHNSDRRRRGSRFVAQARATGATSRTAAPAARRLTALARQRSKTGGGCATPTPASRTGTAVSVRERGAGGGKPATGPPGRGRELDRVSVASCSASEGADEEPPGLDDERRGNAGGSRDKADGRPREREPGNGGGSRAPLRGGGRVDDDGDVGDGGPARGGGRVATLRPGPMARGHQEAEDQGPHGAHAAQAGPTSSSQAADGVARTPTTAEVQAHAGGEDNPPEDAGQGATSTWATWEWGWWNAGTWQSGSSGGKWWDRPEKDDDDDGAWA